MELAACSSHAGAGPIGSRHPPAGRPSSAAPPWSGAGSVPRRWTRTQRLEQRGIQLPGALDVTVDEAAHHLAELLADPVGRDADDSDGADRQKRKGQRVVTAVAVEACPGLGHEPRRARPGCRTRPSRRRCWGTCAARRSIVSSAILRPVRTGMS